MTAPFDLQALAKVPLARAALRLLDFALDHRSLDDTFQRHRGLALERKIAFPQFVRLIADALPGHSAPSAHQTFRRGIENGTLECSVQALYGKLRRMPLWSHTTCPPRASPSGSSSIPRRGLRAMSSLPADAMHVTR